MDDPAWAWPAWKFGMKRDDLFTTLHDQYNTFSFAIQDPEAFHHDVYEVCHLANSTEEFHRFMADRQRQRITEIQESFESLAVEIVANPRLMATDQWQYALQLFRTKSFDSLVRYFASYLPEEYLERHMAASSIPSSRSSFSETDSISTEASSADGGSPPFLDDFFPDGSIIIEEPCSIDTNDDELPVPVPHDAEVRRPGPSGSCGYVPMVSATSDSPRPMSYCDSDDSESDASPGRFLSSFARRPRMEDDEETCQSDESETTTSSICDSTETQSSCDSADAETLGSVKSLRLHVVDDDDDDAVYPTGAQYDDDEFPATQYPEDDFCTLEIRDAFHSYDTPLDSDTSTPRQTHQDSTPASERKPSVAVPLESCIPLSLSFSRARNRRCASPRSHLAHHRAERLHPQDVPRSPEEAHSKIQKTKSSDPFRRRPRGSWSRSSSASCSSRRLD